jgi:hypothetical protein
MAPLGTSQRFSPKREIAIGLGVYAVYLLVRRLGLSGDGPERAERNAKRIVALEERVGLHVEPSLQQLVLPYRGLLGALNLGYATLNVGATAGWLLRLHLRRDPQYCRFRTAAVLAFLGAQPIFLLFPVSPPRKLDHLVDTIAEINGIDLDSGVISKLYHPLAAMPSIHMTIAMVTADGIRETTRRPWARRAATAYPATVAAVVLLTANHYVLDVAAGAVLGRLASRVARRLYGSDESGADV